MVYALYENLLGLVKTRKMYACCYGIKKIILLVLMYLNIPIYQQTLLFLTRLRN